MRKPNKGDRTNGLERDAEKDAKGMLAEDEVG
jgi:hypothetical protein